MTGKEAREIIKSPLMDEYDQSYQYALGYLEALEGEEVKALVKIIEDSLTLYKASNLPIELWHGWIDKFNEKVSYALAQYREAVKK